MSVDPQTSSSHARILPSTSSISSRASTISTNNSDLDSSPSTEIYPILLPTEKSQEVYTRSRQMWEQYLEKAKSMYSIAPECLKLSTLLRRLPALPDDLKGVVTLQGYSMWRQGSLATCPLRTRNGTKQQWNPTCSGGLPTRCIISPAAPFPAWPGQSSRTDELAAHSNGIFILLAGWAYILSKKLLEKQCLPMYFSSNLASTMESDIASEEDHNLITIDVGEVTKDELRWWRAILALGPGWRAPPGQLPPWALRYEGHLRFRIATTNNHLTCHGCGQTPTSAQAALYLAKFSARYNLEIQSPAALAMALTLPLHNAAGSTVEVPMPTLGKVCTFLSGMGSDPYVVDDFENISKYMTLSSNPRFLSSALWGIFWEPGVDCLAVSPWCDGIVEVLEPIVKSKNLELLGHVLALRRPKHAALWYAIILFGQTSLLDALIPFLKSMHAPTPARPIPEVAFWTGMPQSFMDLCGEGPYLQEDDTVSRADVWRLRHDCWELEPQGRPFRSTPLLGWPPFGTMSPEDLEIDVRNHITCDRHQWQYDRWIWEFEGREDLYDEGDLEYEDYNLDLGPLSSFHHQDEILYKSNNIATQAAIGAAFRWAATEIEVSNRNIYTHSWVGADDFPKPGDSELPISTPSLPGQTNEAITTWLEAVSAAHESFEEGMS